jgi:AcrR family transcriptional regulator
MEAGGGEAIGKETDGTAVDVTGGAARRSGRRPGNSGTREAILRAARAQFAQRGYEGATFRSIARDAGVDPALIAHFFGSKQELFVAAVECPFDPAEVMPGVLAADLATLGARLARLFVETWDRAASRNPLIAMLRAATSNEQAARLFRQFIAHELMTPLARRIDGPNAQLRASLVATQLAGLAIIRYVVKLEPLATEDAETVIAQLGATLQHLLTAELPGSG